MLQLRPALSNEMLDFSFSLLHATGNPHGLSELTSTTWKIVNSAFH